jgi:hypothetical protein
MTRRMWTGDVRTTIGVVPMGTRPAASLHQRCAIKGMVETTATCMMSSAAEMHAARSKTRAKIRCVTSRSSVMRGNMTIMAPTMTNLTGCIPQKRDTSQEVSRLILDT